LAEQLDWMLAAAGSTGRRRCDRSAEILYGCGRGIGLRHAVRAKPDERSHVVGTIDLDPAVDALTVSRGAAGKRHRRYRVVPEAGPQPAPQSRCSRPSSPTTSRAHRLH